jgi:hypothetical protein
MLAAAAPAGAATAAAKTGPMLAFTPSPYDYGQVAVGHTASQTFTLANSGGKGSGKLSVTLSGSAAFTITGKTCTGKSLGPGKSCTVTVQFAPASNGAAGTTLSAVSKKATATDALTGATASWGTAVEVPGIASLNAGGTAYVYTQSLSCPSAGNCSAAGSYTDGSGHLQAFVADEVNGTWGNAVEVPGSATLNAGGTAGTISLSCPSAARPSTPAGTHR